MWRKRSLQFRLNALFALVLVLGLAINVGRQLFEAGPRVQAEDESVVRLAREFVETLIGELKDSTDPNAKLSGIVDSLSRLRHISISYQLDPAAPASIPIHAIAAGENSDTPPDWFVALVRPQQTTVTVPVIIGEKPQGVLVIAPHPNDEIAEIWDNIIGQLEIGVALAVALFVVTMFVVNRALAPVQQVADAMLRLEAGRYDTRVAVGGSAEISTICDKLNHLALTLGDAVDDKRHLAERLVSLQDIERKEIARELHDEFGPHLFALRVHAAALKRTADASSPDHAALRKHGDAMLDQINILQQFNRRVLEKLRPVGLSEFGLGAALGAVTQLWRDIHPGVGIDIEISPDLTTLTETVELTVYRVVQEALTNACRHSDATQVSVTIEPARGHDSIQVQVRDNGGGLPMSHKFGHGMIGMRERIMALGGTLSVTSIDGGVTVNATVPGGSQA